VVLLVLLLLLLAPLFLSLTALLLLLSPLLTTLLVLGGVASLRLSLELLLLLLDLLLELGVLLALARSVQRREGVRSDKEGAGAQGNVLRAAHFSDLPVVEVTTDTTGKVAELVADHKSDALSVRGNLDATSNNLDTTVGHVHDFSNRLGVLLGSTNSLGELNLLSVDLDNHSLAGLRA